MFRDTDPHSPAASVHGLRISGLGKWFGPNRVLGGIDLDVRKGELITVLGPSGSGKTTLLRLLCGFERPDTGSIRLGGRLVVQEHRLSLPPEQRGIGYVAQEGALFPHLNIADNLLFGLPRKVRKAGRGERRQRIDRLLDLVGLPSAYATRKPAALSGGEQQRVALARALAPDPAVVLLDEPFSALDAGLRAGLRSAIVDSLQQVGATALLVTHDQDEALSIGDRVAVLQNGRFAQVASPRTLYRFPATRDIAGFVGDAVIVSGRIEGDTVTCRFGRLPLAPEHATSSAAPSEPVDVMIRPEQFRLYPAACATDRDDGETRTAEVTRLTFYGHDAQLELCLPDGCHFRVTASGMDLPATGQVVCFRVAGSVVAYPRESLVGH